MLFLKSFFLCFFFKRNFKVVPNTSGSANTTGERGDRERGERGEKRRKGEGEGETSLYVSGKERYINTFLKPQAKNAFIRTQATEPDSSSCLYMNIQPCVPGTHTSTRTHPRTHAHAHAHRKRMPKKKSKPEDTPK